MNADRPTDRDRPRAARPGPLHLALGGALALLVAAVPLLAGCAPPEDVAASPSSDRADPPAESGALVVRGGTLVDGTGSAPLSDAVLVARAGTLTAVGREGEVDVPADARVVDAAGRWIVPGYVDAHVHFSQTGWFDGRPDAADVRSRHPYPAVVHRLKTRPERFYRAYLCSGITSTFDVGGYPWTRDLQARGEDDTEAVRVAAAGALLSTVDFWLNLPDQRQFVHMASDSVIRRTVESHALLGSSAIKVWYITPSSWSSADSARMSDRVHLAGAAADSVGLPLIVHATGLWEAKDALRAGAEVLVHSVFDDEVDEEFLRLARESGVIYTPTLTVVEGYANAYLGKTAGEMPYPARCVGEATRRKLREGLPEELRPPWARGPDASAPENPALERGIANLERVHGAGVTVATGTDAGNPGTLHGPAIHREVELMARAGMRPTEVLVATTRAAARAMGRADELGTLEAGKLADLVVLSRDPTASVEHLRSVETVVKGGRVVHRRDSR